MRLLAGAFTIVLPNYIFDTACAMTGALAAGMEGVDLLGCVILGFVTALGGGTFRDLRLGRQLVTGTTGAPLCVSVRQYPCHAHPHRPPRPALSTNVSRFSFCHLWCASMGGVLL